jgi:hypothetical protein
MLTPKPLRQIGHDLGKHMSPQAAAGFVARFKAAHEAQVKLQASYSAPAPFVDERRRASRPSGTPELHKALSELNRRVHDATDPTWRIAALVAVAEVGWGEWWNGIINFLRLPPEGRVGLLKQLDMPDAKFEPIVLMSVLREMIRADAQVEDRTLVLRAAAAGLTLPLPPDWPAGLQGLALRNEPVFYPLSGPDLQSLAARLAAELTDDADALSRLRWCHAIACVERDHGCKRNAATGGGPFYLDRARRPDRPSIACCQRHTIAVSRGVKRMKHKRRRKPARGTSNPRGARPT